MCNWKRSFAADNRRTKCKMEKCSCSEQIQLLIERLDRPLGRVGGAAGTGDFVFLAEMRDQVREALAVCGREEGAVVVALAVVLGEMREILVKGRKEDCRRARLQKKRVGENVVGACVRSRADQTLEIIRRVGDSRDHGRATDAHPQARLGKRAYGVEAKVRSRCARLENPCEFYVEGSDRNVDGEFVRAGYFLEQVEVSDHKVRLGDDAKLEAAMQRELLQDGVGDLVAPFRGLVRIGGSAQRDGFAGLDA